MPVAESSQSFGEIAPQAQASVLQSLLALSDAMGESLELDTVLETILDITLNELKAQQGSILLFNENEDRLEMLASRGLPEEIVKKGYIPRKGSIAEYVIENNKGLILNDGPQKKDESYRPVEEKKQARRRIVSALCVPLRAEGKVLGTINLNRTVEDYGSFTDLDLNIAVLLAVHAASCVEQARLHEFNLKSERLAAIGQTVAGISHCVKNMLQGIRGGMTLMQLAAKAEDWSVQEQGHAMLQRNLDRLSGIVLDMLDYSKEREPTRSDVALYDLIMDVATNVKTKADEKGITQKISVAEGLDTVQADNQQLFRCLLNLAQNALDVTPQEGTVEISAELDASERACRRLTCKDAHQGAVIIRVKDSGPGIKAEHLKTIFEPFFSTKGSKGTGLGLAVTRKIVREHGGDLIVESAPDEPAIFAIYLPA